MVRQRTARFATAFVTIALLGTPGVVLADRDTADALEISADIRMRLEQDFDSVNAAGGERQDRLRLRVRARVGLRFTPNEHVSFGVRLRSGADASHQSPHITVIDFDDNDTGDAHFNLDRWYVRGTRGRAWSWVGRNSHPFWRQNELLFDDDATLAGIAGGWSSAGEHGVVGLRAGYFSLPVGMREFAGNLGALQLVYTRPGEVSYTLAAGLYEFEAQPGDIDAPVLLNGNGLRDYSILQASAQVTLAAGDRPLTIGLDWLSNGEDYSPADPDPFTAANADQTDGSVFSLRYGESGEAGAWLVGYQYARIEVLAVNASYAQDDWVRWGSAVESRGSDMKGHELRFGYGLSRQADLLVRLYVAEAIGSIEDGSRARIDLNYRF